MTSPDDAPLRKHDLAPTPLHQVLRWYREALNRQEAVGDIVEPSALNVATCNAAGEVSQRIVLMRAFTPSGPIFVSHRGSRKDRDLAENPSVAGSLNWLPLSRSIHFRGTAELVDEASLEDFWHSRTPAARISALASDQSRPIDTRDLLVERAATIAHEHGDDLPLPDDVAAWRIRVREVEFFSGRADRLHDRLLLTNPSDLLLDQPGWRVQRLMP